MVDALPRRARFVIVGAGVHGLSVAVHLADVLGAGDEIVVLEKQRVGAGATGISGGIVRNFYRAPAINELVRRSVELFELEPSLFGFRQVGYLAVVPEAQSADLELIAQQHREIGYASTHVVGEAAVREHMAGLFPDWRATGCVALLHEERSGWADAWTTLRALAGMARTAGVRIAEGVEVVGLELDGDDVRFVETSAGRIECGDAVVLATGPWARESWRQLGLPPELDVGGSSQPPFHYWQVREGEYVHRERALDARAPVVHLDADVAIPGLQPPWGIYFRPGADGGVAVGGLPLPLPDDCSLDPYGPSHPTDGRTTTEFDDAMATALTWALGRFEDDLDAWTASSIAAPTCFTPDSYPIVGFLRGNAYAILDSNHGFKLLALGQLAARELVHGATEPALEPFRLARFATAALHPASASPYPWT